MVKALKKKFNFLRDVGELSKSERKKYLKICSKENIHIICEAVHNVLKGDCSTKSKKLTKKLRKELEKVANPNYDVTLKRNILSSAQTGDGVFSIIAGTVLPFLIDLLRGKK